MKKLNNYILWIGGGLLAIGIFINYVFVKSDNDDKVNKSLEKARKAKEAKRKERMKRESDEVEQEAKEIINSLAVIDKN